MTLPADGRLFVAPLFQDRAVIKASGPKHLRGTPFELGQDWLGRGTEVYGLTAAFAGDHYLIGQGAHSTLRAAAGAGAGIKPLSDEGRRNVIKSIINTPIPDPFRLQHPIESIINTSIPEPFLLQIEPKLGPVIEILDPVVQAYKKQKLEDEEAFVNSLFK